MFDKAKHESEVDFCNCLNADNMHFISKLNADVRFIDVLHNYCKYNIDDGDGCISKKLDCKYHIDALAHGKWLDINKNEKMTEFRFDVKDVEDKNIPTGNYIIKPNEVDFLEKTTDFYYLAFRLNDGKSKKLSKYIVVDGNELCTQKMHFIDRSTFFLVPLDVIKKCMNKFEIEGDF